MTWSRPEPIRWRSELAWLPVTLGALALTLSFEHWLVHRQVILPALEASAEIPPWMWATLYVPELVVCFVAGWRLRGWRTVVLYAVCAGAVRELFGRWLTLLGEPGHVERFRSPGSDLAVPITVIVYSLVFAFAAESAREPGPEPSRDLGDEERDA
jgi:hypothetical protein